jgi:hypothetical protein
VIVDEQLAREYFPGEDPVGRRINQMGDAEIVGVVASVARAQLGEKRKALIYYPLRQRGTYAAAVAVRGALPPAAAAAIVRAAVAEADRQVPVHDVKPMRARVEESVGARRLAAWAMGGFAGVAVVLAALGLYGVLSYVVAQRARDLGVRAALGASAGAVTRLVVGRRGAAGRRGRRPGAAALRGRAARARVAALRRGRGRPRRDRRRRRGARRGGAAGHLAPRAARGAPRPRGRAARRVSAPPAQPLTPAAEPPPVLNDLRLAARALRRAPAFALATALTLALGMGATTALFAAVRGVLLRPLPYPRPEQLVRRPRGRPGGGALAFADPNFDDLRRGARAFSALAAYRGAPRGRDRRRGGGARAVRRGHARLLRGDGRAARGGPGVRRPTSCSRAARRPWWSADGFWRRAWAPSATSPACRSRWTACRTRWWA